LFAANVTLALFNLIPAFPMDGGRVLRALLAMRMTDARATQIAAAIGQGLAIALGFLGLMIENPVLIFIAFFVFLGAGQEVSSTLARSFLEGHLVQEAMQKQFRAINSGANLEAAARQLLEGAQKDFPVVAGEGGEVLGVLMRDDIAHGLAREGPAAYVAGHMHRDFKTVEPETSLEAVIDMFGSGDSTPILVMKEGELVGMVTQENLSEFIVLAAARQQRRR
jgi:CBS domain-containing protein